MSRGGQSENAALIQNALDQLDRLVQQRADLDEAKEELEPEEFEELSRETQEQLEEFEEFLRKMQNGNVSLVDQVGAVQLALQAAVSNAFRTPEVIRFFAQKQPNALRSRLSELERDHKIGKIGDQQLTNAKVEVLAALRKLGEQLQSSELAFLNDHASQQTKLFVSVDANAAGVSEQQFTQAMRANSQVAGDGKQ